MLLVMVTRENQRGRRVGIGGVSHAMCRCSELALGESSEVVKSRAVRNHKLTSKYNGLSSLGENGGSEANGGAHQATRHVIYWNQAPTGALMYL
jgi:hypothetical protein